MSITRKEGSSWVDIGSAKRYDGSQWVECDFIKAYENNRWVEKWANWKPNFLTESMINKANEVGSVLYTPNNGLYTDYVDGHNKFFSTKDAFITPYAKNYTYLHATPYCFIGFWYDNDNRWVPPSSTRLVIGFSSSYDESVPIKTIGSSFRFTRRDDEEVYEFDRVYGANERDLSSLKINLSTINNEIGSDTDTYDVFGIYILIGDEPVTIYNNWLPGGASFSYVGFTSLYFD